MARTRAKARKGGDVQHDEHAALRWNEIIPLIVGWVAEDSNRRTWLRKTDAEARSGNKPEGNVWDFDQWQKLSHEDKLARAAGIVIALHDSASTVPIYETRTARKGDLPDGASMDRAHVKQWKASSDPLLAHMARDFFWHVRSAWETNNALLAEPEIHPTLKPLPVTAVHPTPTVSMSPELVEQLKEAAVRLPAVLDGNRAGLERIAGVLESMSARDSDDAPPRKLPPLKPWAMEAWKLKQFGMTVSKIAETLAERHDDSKITQPRVTEQIQRAELHTERSGLAGDAAKVLPQVGTRAPARTLDPAAAELGKRTDGRAQHLRERERQKAKDGDDEE